MSTHEAFIEGIAFWSPSMPGWEYARTSLRSEEGVEASAQSRRPSPELLPVAERRRVPDSVAIALEVATRSVAQSGRSPTELLSVFTSAHGDPAITDYVCATLVKSPLLISPIKFHNSVHNAASGYWGIATGCRLASTAVSAFHFSFAAGLLEALGQCAADHRPVLVVGYDIAAAGALLSTNDSRGLLAVSLVLAPSRGERTLASLSWCLADGVGETPPLRSPSARSLADNAMSDALPLFEALAAGGATALALPVSTRASLALRIGPLS